jgi:hypothetical protein
VRCQPGGKYAATLVRSAKEQCFLGGGLTAKMAERGGSAVRSIWVAGICGWRGGHVGRHGG